jgi:signal transduction histidine kinase
VRRRLVRSIVLVAAAAVVLFALPLAFAVHRSYRDEELLRLQRDTVAATRAIDIAAPAGDPLELPQSRDRLAIYNDQGRRVSGVGPALGDTSVIDALRGRRPSDQATGNSLVAAVPVLRNERVVGVLRAQRGDEAVEHASRRAWVLLGVIGLAVIGLAGLAATVLGRRLAAPLEQLAGAASRLGSGDFAVRAPTTGVPEADEVARAMDTTAERLDALISRERSFSADASHQLRTPLAALRIEIESLQLEGHSEPQLARAVEQLDRIESTIDTLIAVARDSPRAVTEVELVALLDAAAERWRGRFAADGRPLRVLTPPAQQPAAASPDVVREIVDVLLDNALHHGAGEVRMTVREHEGWLVVEVTDRGQGFAGDPEEAFARRSRNAAGHGIGLALARSLAHAEGGRLAIVDAGPQPVISLTLRRADPERSSQTHEPGAA